MPYFPTGAPLVFIPTDGSFPVPPNHPHVDYASGLVCIPYLSSWDVRSSTLLFAVDAAVVALSAAQHTEQFQNTLVAVSPTPNTPEHSRSELITSLTKRTRNDLSNFRKLSLDTFQNLYSSQQRFEQLSLKLHHHQRHFLHNRKASLSSHYTSLQNQYNSLTAWNQRLLQSYSSTSADKSNRPPFSVHQQAISCIASDYAIDDVLAQIDEAICNGVISVGVYVSTTRRVSREQFFTRALLQKIERLLANAKSPCHIELQPSTEHST